MARLVSEVADLLEHAEDLLDPQGSGRSPATSVYAKIAQAKGAVTNSVEFQRIAALPRRKVIYETLYERDAEGNIVYKDDAPVVLAAAVPDLTPIFQKPGGTMKLRREQSAALLEAARANGLFAALAVGVGKSLIALLLTEALDSKRAVLLIPPALKRQVLREIDEIYAKHFILPLDRLEIVTYHELSQAKTADVLDRIKPDLIIADEAHNLRHLDSARTKRFRRFMDANAACRFCGLSGTMTSRSLVEYAHLIEYALRKGSPVPKNYRELKDWAGAIDVKPEYEMLPGVLMQFCEEGETVREGFRRRLTDTRGVVASDTNAVGASLIVRRRNLVVPLQVQRTLAEVRKSWSISGDEFADVLTYARVLRQVASGFHYKWAWPGGEPDYEWLEARGNWHKAVREKLKRSIKGMDSPLLLAQAAERALKGKTGANVWVCSEWAAWKAVKDRPVPPIETVWLDDFLVADAIALARAADEPTIIWYEHRALGDRFEELGIPTYGQGTDASTVKEPIIACSIRVQGTGKNLQHYSNNVITTLPPSGSTVEQLLGRTHRQGQLADVVTASWYGHTDETRSAMVSVIADAQYVEQSTGAQQKILYATRLEPEPETQT